jgi:ornithine carbamoyltransferase
MRHFIDLLDLTREELCSLFSESAKLKKAREAGVATPILTGRVLGLVFEKPSLRTRVSFQTAIAQLGGDSVFLAGQEVGLGSRESVADFARVMSQYVDAVVLRTFSHKRVENFAKHSGCPVINGLSDYYHPCQALADLFTVQETFGSLAGRTVTFVGDGNNVARSLAICCAKLGVQFVLSSPKGYGFDKRFLEIIAGKLPGSKMVEESNPEHAVAEADIVYTDVWASMGQEAEQKNRIRKFAGHQLNSKLLSHAPMQARVMHCLPAHREQEITSEVLDSERSIVIQQAANRLHAQKALLKWLLAKPEQPSESRG